VSYHAPLDDELLPPSRTVSITGGMGVFAIHDVGSCCPCALISFFSAG
jgi:hypothetical protein